MYIKVLVIKNKDSQLSIIFGINVNESDLLEACLMKWSNPNHTNHTVKYSLSFVDNQKVDW